MLSADGTTVRVRRSKESRVAEKQWLVTKTLLLYCTHCIAVGLIRLVVRNPHPEHVRVNVTDDSWFVVLFGGGRDLCWDQADDDRVVPFSDVRWQLQLSGQVAAMLVPLTNTFVKLEHFVHRSEMVCTEMCQTIFNFRKRILIFQVAFLNQLTCVSNHLQPEMIVGSFYLDLAGEMSGQFGLDERCHRKG